MDEINQIISPDTQSTVLQVLAVLTMLMPLIEKAAAKSANKWDDRVVAAVARVLAFIPRVRTGGAKPATIAPPPPAPAKRGPNVPPVV
jgi:hypothetical protein